MREQNCHLDNFAQEIVIFSPTLTNLAKNKVDESCQICQINLDLMLACLLTGECNVLKRCTCVCTIFKKVLTKIHVKFTFE